MQFFVKQNDFDQQCQYKKKSLKCFRISNFYDIPADLPLEPIHAKLFLMGILVGISRSSHVYQKLLRARKKEIKKGWK